MKNVKDYDTSIYTSDIDVRIILKWILKKWDGVQWTGLLWLRIGTGGGLL